jgi:hypothetical protein
LRATLANRLSAAGVPEATVAELMWHARNNVTRHYMVSHLSPLQEAVERIAVRSTKEDVSLASLRRANPVTVRKAPRT